MFFLAATECCSGTVIGPIPNQIAGIIAAVIFLIKVIVPIALVIFGMLDLGKAVMSQKEDEIKKGQQTFLKRLVAAAVVFLVIFIVQVVIQIAAGSDSGSDSIWGCAKCVMEGGVRTSGGEG